MKLLIDENLPKALKQHLPAHESYTVRDMGWQSKKNGELLTLMIAEGFDVLITFDKNLQHQQNFAKYPIAVVVVDAKGNSMPFLEPLLSQLQAALIQSLSPGVTVISLP